MKKVLWGISLVALASLSIAVAPAGAAEYRAFVGCDDLTGQPVPAHVCEIGDFPGAYFEADTETEYEVCVNFPSGEELCAEEQLAESGVLYVNSITTEIPGTHLVTWYVEGIEVASWTFRMDIPTPPPAPVLPTPIAQPPATPPVAAVVSASCLKAEQRVGTLRGKLHHASGHRAKAKLQARLKAARVSADQAC